MTIAVYAIKTISYNNFMKKAESTVAVVTKITEWEDRDDDVTSSYYVIEVNYNIDGTEYDSKIQKSNTRLKVNDIITIYYIAGDERNIRLEKENNSTSTTSMTFMFIVGFMLLSTFTIIFRKKK